MELKIRDIELRGYEATEEDERNYQVALELLDRGNELESMSWEEENEVWNECRGKKQWLRYDNSIALQNLGETLRIFKKFKKSFESLEN